MMTPDELRKLGITLITLPVRCGCGTELHEDDTIWFWCNAGDESERDILVDTTVGSSVADEFFADGEEGFCSRDCGHESRAANAEARWFEDAAYGTDDE